VCRYLDDEPGSPWTIALHVDRQGDDAQRAALETLFLEGLQNLPWIRKARHLIGVRVSEIEIDGPAHPRRLDDLCACDTPRRNRRAGRLRGFPATTGSGVSSTRTSSPSRKSRLLGN